MKHNGAARQDASHRPRLTSDALSLGVPHVLIEAVAQRLADVVVERIEKQDRRPEPWLDVEAAARYLTCGDQRIYDLVSQRRLRVARDGRRLLFRREWLDGCLGEDSTER
jgi:excisionase family DNA binding protein